MGYVGHLCIRIAFGIFIRQFIFCRDLITNVLGFEDSLQILYPHVVKGALLPSPSTLPLITVSSVSMKILDLICLLNG